MTALKQKTVLRYMRKMTGEWSISILRKKDEIKRGNLEEKEDDPGIEDDLWVSLLYTDVDYSLLDTPTSINGGRAVTNHGNSSGRSALFGKPTNPTEERVMTILGSREI